MGQAVFLKGITVVGEVLNPTAQVSTSLQAADQVLNNEFFFLNKAVRFPGRINWSCSDQEKLWRYHLHYFDYFHSLGISYLRTKRGEYYRKFKTLAEDWIKENPIGKGIGWEPFPLSMRVVNWIYASSFFKDQMAQEIDFQRTFIRSLYLQVAFLSRNLEYHLLNNHLVKNAKALLLGGIFFPNRKWIKAGNNLLLKTLRNQVLADGGHFERSPMYHLIVLQDYMEVLVALRDNGLKPPDKLERKIVEMVDFISGIIQPDGEIPLFNDATFDMPVRPRELIAIGRSLFQESWKQNDRLASLGIYSQLLLWGGQSNNSEGKMPARKAGIPKAFFESGYFVIRDENEGIYLIVDCGELGPEHNLGHAHADLLSFELSLDSQRMIVDSGVNSYSSLPDREYFRSTRAHNTIEVEGNSQAELWNSFRIARSAHPVKKRWKVGEGYILFEGSHDGFTRIARGLTHSRKIILVNGAFLIIWDTISGRGEYRIKSYLHFHPEVISKTLVENRQMIILVKRDGRRLRIVPYGNCETNLYSPSQEDACSWYSSNFGKKQPNAVVISSLEASLPASYGYLMTLDQGDSIKASIQDDGVNFKADVELRSYRYILSDDGETIELKRDKHNE
jgi:uncharacterized heparinase superfamily protein